MDCDLLYLVLSFVRICCARQLVACDAHCSSNYLSGLSAPANASSSHRPQVDYWLEFSSCIVAGAGLDALCGSLNEYLAYRTLLVGHGLTLADLAVWGQLQASPMWIKVRGTGKVPHLVRWFNHVAVQPACMAAIAALDTRKKPVASDASGAKANGKS